MEECKKSRPIVKVIGIGNGGSNIVNRMYDRGIHGMSFALCDTDRQALCKSPVEARVFLEQKTCGKPNAGNIPEITGAITEKDRENIGRLFNDGTRMAFIIAGMGGATGTRAVPVITRMCRDMGILTVGILTTPLLCEGHERIIPALDGIGRTAGNVDALLVVNSEHFMGGNITPAGSNTFTKINDMIMAMIKDITDIITIPGHISLDFSDVKTILKDGGITIISSGYGEGENRMEDAIVNALHSPLLNNNDVSRAKKILFNIYSSEEAPLIIEEMDAVANFMKRLSHDTEFIWGTAIDEKLDGKVKMTMLATGFKISDVL
ncbi:MAG: cell division FtsZ family protein [Prevotella sp.]|jgi:cell division protein FtsZ|nr:cell division FtsZ family protein [Prevotella sp.]